MFGPFQDVEARRVKFHMKRTQSSSCSNLAAVSGEATYTFTCRSVVMGSWKVTCSNSSVPSVGWCRERFPSGNPRTSCCSHQRRN